MSDIDWWGEPATDYWGSSNSEYDDEYEEDNNEE
jgi:hypothetical protein